MKSIDFMFPRFLIPHHISFKKGCVALLRGVDAKKITLIVGAKSAEQSGALEKVVGHLKRGNENIIISFFKVPHEPTWLLIQEAATLIKETSADWVIGLGGGAVMDTTKLAFALSEYPHLKISDILKPFSFPKLSRKRKLLLVPTTSGSGSEVSSSAVLQNDEERVKRVLVSHEFLPDMVLLDPSLTLTLPPHLTASTGMDAITHCVEAFVSTAHHPFGDACAVAALRLLFFHLPTAFVDAENILARESLLYAACMAGIAHNHASVGLTHALAHKIGAETGLHHGFLNSLFLLPVMNFNLEKAQGRYEELARACGYVTCLDIVEAIRELQLHVKMPMSLIDAGYNTPLPTNDAFIHDVLVDPCTRTNPRKPAENDILEIIKHVHAN